MPEVGDTIDEYRLTGVLGQGGFGVVWVAHSERLQQEVALKILHQHLVEERVNQQGPTVAERFLAEARLLQRLYHPGFCEIYSVIEDRDKGIVAYAMERLVGADLSACATDLNLGEILEVFAKTADTLSYLHENGVIHRDIKAANIFITDPRHQENGVKQVKLLDFGVAKELHAEAGLVDTATGCFFGSVNSMPPESFRRWEEEGESVRPSIDQWALGVTLYHCLSGKMPFTGATMVDLFISIEHDPYEYLELLPRFELPLVPEQLEELIDRCLAKEPLKRYGTMRDLAQAFRETATSLGQAEGTVVSNAGFIDETATAEPALGVVPAPAFIRHDTEEELEQNTECSLPGFRGDTKSSDDLSDLKIPDTRSVTAPTSGDRQLNPKDHLERGWGTKIPVVAPDPSDRIPDDIELSTLRRRITKSGAFLKSLGKTHDGAGVRLSVAQFIIWLTMMFLLGFLTCFIVFGFSWNG